MLHFLSKNVMFYHTFLSKNVIKYYWRYEIMGRLRRKIDQYLIDWKNTSIFGK